MAALTLPDDKDKHVLAAAIKINADIIVTNNLKYFPPAYLAMFDLTAKSADDFITDIIDLDQDRSLAAFRELVLNHKNPPLDAYQVLNAFRQNRLINSANYLHSLI